MATRANVFIRDSKSDSEKEILYHHWDGYPSGVGVILAGIFNTIPIETSILLTKSMFAQLINNKKGKSYICIFNVYGRKY